ncbi:MAG: hypothetical protein AB1846_02235 [Chloroflexota bacterium]
MTVIARNDRVLRTLSGREAGHNSERKNVGEIETVVSGNPAGVGIIALTQRFSPIVHQ